MYCDGIDSRVSGGRGVGSGRIRLRIISGRWPKLFDRVDKSTINSEVSLTLSSSNKTRLMIHTKTQTRQSTEGEKRWDEQVGQSTCDTNVR